MIFIDQMQNLKIYKKPMVLPTSSEFDKKKKSAIFLLTPNYESSKQLMNTPMTINRMRFQSYYLERDVSYYISGKVKKIQEDEDYVREASAEELYHNLNDMTLEKKEQLKESDFGLPEQRKYPLSNPNQIRNAIRYFNFCDESEEKELAKNLLKAIKESNMKINLGKRNRFYKYFIANEVGIDGPVNDVISNDIMNIATDCQNFLRNTINDENIKNIVYSIPSPIKNDISFRIDYVVCTVMLSDGDTTLKIVLKALEEYVKANYADKVEITFDTANTDTIAADDIAIIKVSGKIDEKVYPDNTVIESAAKIVKVMNTPKDPIKTFSAIITNPQGFILLRENSKGQYTLPSGVIKDTENSLNALYNNLDSELGIQVNNSELYGTYSFIEEYPIGTGKYFYEENSCYMITSYIGEITNNHPEEYKSIVWMNRDDINNDTEMSKSEILKNYIADYQCDRNTFDRTAIEALSSLILFSGYQSDVEEMKKIITPQFYYAVVSALCIPAQEITDLPIWNIEVVDEIKDTAVGDTNINNGHVQINFALPKYDESNYSVDEYIDFIYSCTAMATIEGLFGNSIGTYLARIFVDYLIDNDSVYASWGSDLFDGEKPIMTPEDYIEICKNGDTRKIYEIIKAKHPDQNIDILSFMEPDSYMEGWSTPITAQNLQKKFKYATTTKVKRKFSMHTKQTKRLMKQIKQQLETMSHNSGITSPSSSADSEISQVDASLGEGVIEQDLFESEYLNLGNIVTFFTESSTTNMYNSQLRSLLYSERIKQRKELLNKYKTIKAENPGIIYTYPEIESYKQKNVFIDLSYYNEIFFRNNLWKLKKGYNLYLTLLERLINDPRLNNAGYTKKTVFIPILDWNYNRSTKMWLYRQSINPISIIFELMQSDMIKIKEIFKNINLVFFTPDKLFKIDIDDFNKDNEKIYTMRFKNFIDKITKNMEFDDDEIDNSIDSSESPREIRTNIIDKIELAKGIDITPNAGTVNTLKNKQKADISSFQNALMKNSKIANDPNSTKKQRDVAIAKSDEIDKSGALVYRSYLAKSNVNTPSPIEKSKDKEIKNKVLSKASASEVETDIKQKNLELDKLAAGINDIADKSTSTDDALAKMDGDSELDIKSIIINLDSMKDSSVKMNDTRAARMNDLDKKFLSSEVAGKSVKEILDTKDNVGIGNPIEKTTLNIASPNPEWKDLHYMNFDKDYDLNTDIVKCFYHFTKVSKPIAIRNINVEDHSTSEDRLDLYTVEMEDFRGKRFTIKLDIPRAKDNRFLLRGYEKTMQIQLFNMPILKTDLDTCQIISNYEKIFIERFNATSGKSYPVAGKILKAINKYKGTGLKITLGNNSRICNKYELPIDYIDIASSVDTIEGSNFTIYFNQDIIREKYPNIDDTFGVPYAVYTNGDVVYYRIPEDDSKSFSDDLFERFLAQDSDFYKAFNAAKAPAWGTYSLCSILNTKIPLVVVTGYCEGLTKVMNKAGIKYKLLNTLPNEYKNISYDYIKFEDGYLVYEVSYASCLLLNGLRDCATELYSIMDIDDKNFYAESLDNFGGKSKADGIENFYDCLVDPITEENLIYYHLPTDFVSIMLYANALLADNKFIKHTDTTSRRIRRTELVAAYTYEALALAYGTYANQIKHGKANAVISLKQSVIIDKIMASPICSDASVTSALNDVETTNSVTFKGKAGLNSERSYSLDKRGFDDSMLNILGVSTNFSAKIGITRQATIDMNVEGSRGYIKSIDGDTSQMDSAKSLSAAEAVTPFGTTRDDATRVNMTFVQTAKHQLRTEDSDPLLVTNGADEVLPYLTTDKFAFKAKDDGTVIELNTSYMIIQYKNTKNKDYINLSETIEKNSDGGFYVPMQLSIAEGIKLNSKFTKGQILAYDKKSFSNNVGESNNIAYNIGKLVKVAVINTDDGYEDSGMCSSGLAEKLATRIIHKVDQVVDKDSIIYKMVNVGDTVNVEDALLVWQNPHDEEDIESLMKMMNNNAEDVSELGRKSVRSKWHGTVAGIKMYRTIELSDMSDSLKKIVENYERPINSLRNTLKTNGIDYAAVPATYKLDPAGKLKRAVDAVFIEFYIEFVDTIAVGDKITYFSANKATMKDILPPEKTPYTDFRPHEPIDAFVSEVSIDHRMVTSTLIYGSLQKALVEMDRSIKDMLGIKYDDSKV